MPGLGTPVAVVNQKCPRLATVFLTEPFVSPGNHSSHDSSLCQDGQKTNQDTKINPKGRGSFLDEVSDRFTKVEDMICVGKETERGDEVSEVARSESRNIQVGWLKAGEN